MTCDNIGVGILPQDLAEAYALAGVLQLHKPLRVYQYCDCPSLSN
jgi:hypothetical protein